MATKTKRKRLVKKWRRHFDLTNDTKYIEGDIFRFFNEVCVGVLRDIIDRAAIITVHI